MSLEWFRVENNQWVPMLGRTTPTGPQRFYGDPMSGKILLGSSNDDPDMTFDDIESDMNHTLGLARRYYQADQVNTAAKNDIGVDHSKNRVPFVSFKCPGTWASVANGLHDDWLNDITQMVDSFKPNPVWVCLHHEPRNDGQPDADWAKMYVRATPIFRQAENLVIAPIVAGSSFDPKQGDPDPDVWRVPTADIMCADWYNQWWIYATSATDCRGASETYKKWWEGPDRYEAFFERVVSWGDGTPMGMAEYGVHYAWKEPGKSAQWLRNTYEYCVDRGDVAALSYFYSGKNSPRGAWGLYKYARPGETGCTYYFNEQALADAAGVPSRIDEFARELALPSSCVLSDLTLA